MFVYEVKLTPNTQPIEISHTYQKAYQTLFIQNHVLMFITTDQINFNSQTPCVTQRKFTDLFIRKNFAISYHILISKTKKGVYPPILKY